MGNKHTNNGCLDYFPDIFIKVKFLYENFTLISVVFCEFWQTCIVMQPPPPPQSRYITFQLYQIILHVFMHLAIHPLLSPLNPSKQCFFSFPIVLPFLECPINRFPVFWVWLLALSINAFEFIHPVILSIVHPLYYWAVFHSMDIQFVYPFSSWGIFALFTVFGDRG